MSGPFVLIRKNKPTIRFAGLDEAKRFFDQQRMNGAAKSEGVIFGPEKVCWRCQSWRSAIWVLDTSDRRKERAEAMGEETEETP